MLPAAAPHKSRHTGVLALQSFFVIYSKNKSVIKFVRNNMSMYTVGSIFKFTLVFCYVYSISARI